jgi:hypothetical protein
MADAARQSQWHELTTLNTTYNTHHNLHHSYLEIGQTQDSLSLSLSLYKPHWKTTEEESSLKPHLTAPCLLHLVYTLSL